MTISAVLYRSGEFDTAADVIDKVLSEPSIDPDRVAILLARRALIDFEQGKENDADARMSNALAARASHNVLNSAGTLAFRRGRPEEARLYFERVIEMMAPVASQPAHIRGFACTGLAKIAVQSGDLAAALAYCERAIWNNPQGREQIDLKKAIKAELNASVPGVLRKALRTKQQSGSTLAEGTHDVHLLGAP